MKCFCDDFGPTTIVNDLEGIFKDSNLNQVFTKDAINALANFEFWNSFVIYFFFIQSVLMAIALYKGFKKDKKDREILK